jgi:hypothetical protein
MPEDLTPEEEEFEQINDHLQDEFGKLPDHERVRFFYQYACLLLDTTELRNLAKLINDRLPKT